MARSRRQALWDRIASGDTRNVGFDEFRRLLEAFGFTLRRIGGSHHIYTHPDVPRPLSVQPHRSDAKPYQIRQFVEMVEQYGLRLEARR